MRLSPSPLISAEQIRQRVAHLGRQIDAEYSSLAGEDGLIFVVILTGGLFFSADLARNVNTPLRFEFVAARSYEKTQSNGHVVFTHRPERSLEGKHVLVIEDILDTGRTASAVLDLLKADKPASLALCALLDKPSRRITPIQAKYVGFSIDDHFVVGYGLDYEQQGRHLPEIFTLERE